MARRIRWGILSTARIGTEKVIPAMQKGEFCRIDAIASRELSRAKAAAGKLGIARAYGSYEQLLGDPDIDAIYNPLPNHLHVPWTMKALEAGKHVLCEKPIAMDAGEAEDLRRVAARYPSLKVMEAFMYKFHPQWKKVGEIVGGGRIGEVRTIHSCFFIDVADPRNIRNDPTMGGGGLMDIGCYCISYPRLILGKEPIRVAGVQDIDPVMKIDRLTTAILEFAGGVTATFSCGMQHAYGQRCLVYGTKGALDIPVPTGSSATEPMRLLSMKGDTADEIVIPPADRYQLQGDAFSRAIIDDTPAPYSLDEAVSNMKVIDAVFRSAREKRWVYLP